MSEKPPYVTRKVRIEEVSQLPTTEELPSALQEAAVFFEALGAGWFEELGRKALVLRKNGYQICTCMVFFFALFTAPFSRSIKRVCQELGRPKNQLLAAFAGLKTFPQQSSISRFLMRADLDRIEASMAWLLVFSHQGARELLNHIACACRDTFGNPWQLFDLDPTATVLRQRSLPDDEELPPLERISDTIAEPGYTGRKRGEVLFRRVVLQHTGSALWLGSWLRRGNRGARQAFEAAAKTVVQCCEFAGFDKEKAILRIDGEGGNVPTITACIEAGIHHLTRCVHYGLFERPEVREHLITGHWFEVEDSGSGPRRLALDLGEVELSAGAGTTHEDNTPYEPIRSRVVVSRFAAEQKTSSGILIEGALYELYATSLPAAQWPAPEVVGLYYHHATQENRFGREDKELGLDNVFSYEPGGQSLVTIVGLLVWNLRLLLGFRAARQQLDQEPLVPQLPRQARPALAPMRGIAEPANEPDELCQSATDEVAESMAKESHDPDPLLRLEQQLREYVDEQAQKLCDPRYTWHTEHGLKCRASHLFEPTRTRLIGEIDYLMFLAPPKVCGSCPERIYCSNSIRPNLRKERAIRIADRDWVDALLRQIQDTKTQTRRALYQHSSPPKRRRRRPSFEPSESESARHLIPESGPFEVALPMLNPAALRYRFHDALADLAIAVRTHPEPAPAIPRRYTYTSRADRARRRKTWEERLSYNHRRTSVDISVIRAPLAATLFSTA